MSTCLEGWRNKVPPTDMYPNEKSLDGAALRRRIHDRCLRTQDRIEVLCIVQGMRRPIWIKNKIKFSSYIREFRVEQLQSHIWLTASSFMGKYLRISSYIRKPFLINDFATTPLWISLYIRKIWYSFLSVQGRIIKGTTHRPRNGTTKTFH
jgi:hypothetical protein